MWERMQLNTVLLYPCIFGNNVSWRVSFSYANMHHEPNREIGTCSLAIRLYSVLVYYI